MPFRIAFMGFRHGHIYDLHSRAQESSDYEVVAACEEDEATRNQLAESGAAQITHDSYERMLDEAPCDIIAVGDYYGKRGRIIIEALRRGKHAISDKPICTSLDDLDQIEALSKEKGLSVGCMLDMRDCGHFIKVRELVRSRAIGEVNAISFGGQHPLMLGKRPAWYFEEGKHGGTINDIGSHAFDLIPWMTGLTFDEVMAARSWNAVPKDIPYFHDAGQFMMRMSNGCGVFGDVSYFMPDSIGYSSDLYWRFTIWGSGGVIETSYNMKGIRLLQNGKEAEEFISPAEGNPGGYLRSFTAELRGEPADLSTAAVLRAARTGLTVQAAGMGR